MESKIDRQANIRLISTLGAVLATVGFSSCSPDGAGSISVPGGKDKLKIASKIGSVKLKPNNNAGTFKVESSTKKPSQPLSGRD
jgi:hypothetical protein